MVMAEFELLGKKNRERYLRIVTPVGNLFARIGVHPNVLSVMGLILSIVAGLFYAMGYFFGAGCVVILAGTCDVLDGLLARQTGKASRFGAFFDSTLDRFGEVFIFMGLAWYFSGGGIFFGQVLNPSSHAQSPLAVVLIILCIAGSFMVSYTRARAEALGVDCKVGLMQRPERITLLIIGSLLGGIPVVGIAIIKVTLVVLAVLTNITALQRMAFVKKALLRKTESP
ncbi:MAG TPA: CDP-alcohol phosphatidyltransferase family protein [Desulfobacteraceae bacterium]|nr:CDP-alcohol phosphatidyltransferase family protein [Desulfobacteraceae bacterium]